MVRCAFVVHVGWELDQERPVSATTCGRNMHRSVMERLHTAGVVNETEAPAVSATAVNSMHNHVGFGATTDGDVDCGLGRQCRDGADYGSADCVAGRKQGLAIVDMDG